MTRATTDRLWKWAIVGAALGLGAFALRRPTNRPQPSLFGKEVLGRALADLGLTETSKNAGARIDDMLAKVGASSPNNWCAAAVATWIQEAADLSMTAKPIPGSANAKETMRQFQAADPSRAGWIDVAALRENPGFVVPGMISVWHRGAPGALTGHIGVVESYVGDDRRYTSIEGNSGPTGDRVARMTRSLDDMNLLGMGYFA